MPFVVIVVSDVFIGFIIESIPLFHCHAIHRSIDPPKCAISCYSCISSSIMLSTHFRMFNHLTHGASVIVRLAYTTYKPINIKLQLLSRMFSPLARTESLFIVIGQCICLIAIVQTHLSCSLSFEVDIFAMFWMDNLLAWIEFTLTEIYNKNALQSIKTQHFNSHIKQTHSRMENKAIDLFRN